MLDVIEGGKKDRTIFDKYNTPASKLMFPVGEREAAWRGRDGQFYPAPTHKAIIRMNKEGNAAQLLNVVGVGYKLIHNRELFSAIEDAMITEMLPEHLDGVRVTDKIAHFGKLCFREYVFPNIKCRLPNSPSDIGFRIIVQNGYGGSALKLHAGAIDFYCTNGMVRGEYTATYRRHTKGLFLGNLVPNIKAALDEFTIAGKEWTRWTQTSVKHQDAMQLFKDLASSDKQTSILSDQYLHEREVRGENLWAVYSTLTNIATHTKPQRTEENDSEAATMLRHEMDVYKWTQSKEWKVLENA